MQSYTGRALTEAEWRKVFAGIDASDRDGRTKDLAKLFLSDITEIPWYLREIEAHATRVTAHAFTLDPDGLIRRRGADAWDHAREITGRRSYLASLDGACVEEAGESEIAAHRFAILRLEHAVCDAEIVELTAGEPGDIGPEVGLQVDFAAFDGAHDAVDHHA